MSNQEINQISSATGTFAAVKVQADAAPKAGKVAPESGKEPPVKEQEQPDLESLAAKLNVASRSIGRDLRFKVDMDSGNSVIQVLDRDTGEIIREIPPDKAKISVSISGDMQLRLYDELA